MDRFGWLPYPFETVSDAERQKGLPEPGRVRCCTRHVSRGSGSDRVTRDLITSEPVGGIKVAFYLMPESPTFRTVPNQGPNRALTDYVTTLSREYGVPVSDATDWLPEESFSDGHHMLKSGAKAFGERFSRECLEPWIGTK